MPSVFSYAVSSMYFDVKSGSVVRTGRWTARKGIGDGGFSVCKGRIDGGDGSIVIWSVNKSIYEEAYEGRSGQISSAKGK